MYIEQSLRVCRKGGSAHTLEIPPSDGFILIEHTKKCTSGSLTGAVAPLKVTEACEGKLNGSWKLSEEYNGISLPDCKTQQVEQRRKSVIVIQKYRVEGLLLNESKIR